MIHITYMQFISLTEVRLQQYLCCLFQGYSNIYAVCFKGIAISMLFVLGVQQYLCYLFQGYIQQYLCCLFQGYSNIYAVCFRDIAISMLFVLGVQQYLCCLFWVYSNIYAVCFGGFASHSRIFSLTWRRHHYRSTAANFDLYAALMAIKQ